jgi:hypothetical protein
MTVLVSIILISLVALYIYRKLEVTNIPAEEKVNAEKISEDSANSELL